MAAILTYVSSRTTEHPTDLCPTCWKPSLRLHHLLRIDMDGVTTLGERVACRDEKTWITDLKEYPSATDSASPAP